MAVAAVLVACLAASSGAGAGLRTTATIPPIDGEVAAHVRQIAAAGAAEGRRADVFAKVGDSITVSDSFLKGLACDEPAWGRWTGLAATREYFGLHTFPDRYASVPCDRANSFSRDSVAAKEGWSAVDALVPIGGHAPPGCEDLNAVACEYRLINPSVALIMFGTNDVESAYPPAFKANLAMIVADSIETGVVPVLSTIPPRPGPRRRGHRVARFNRLIVDVAGDAQIPLWNYWRALQGPRLAHHGIGPDGIHPNAYVGGAFDFTRVGLRYGYNQRNLGALRVLERVRAAIGS